MTKPTRYRFNMKAERRFERLLELCELRCDMGACWARERGQLIANLPLAGRVSLDTTQRCSSIQVLLSNSFVNK